MFSIFQIIVMTSRTSNQTPALSREVGRIAGASRHPRLETEPTPRREGSAIQNITGYWYGFDNSFIKCQGTKEITANERRCSTGFKQKILQFTCYQRFTVPKTLIMYGLPNGDMGYQTIFSTFKSNKDGVCILFNILILNCNFKNFSLTL